MTHFENPFTALSDPVSVRHQLETWKQQELPVAARPHCSRPLALHERKLLQDVSDLGNYVLATKAMQSLAKLRSRHRSLFSSVVLYLEVLRTLSHEHYKQPVRAFVLDMFDLCLDQPTVTLLLELDRQACNETLPSASPARRGRHSRRVVPEFEEEGTNSESEDSLTRANATSDNQIPKTLHANAPPSDKATTKVPQTIMTGFDPTLPQNMPPIPAPIARIDTNIF